LIFVPPQFHLTSNAEKAFYDQHENDPMDPRYRAFLSRLTTPLLARLPLKAHGLDYGCGPGPALALILLEAGHTVRLYDPFYWNDDTVWNDTYDFITTTEVVEHWCRPAKEWSQLIQILRPGGWLGVMTKRVQDPQAFDRWHYILDPTHVSFYSIETFAWIAAAHGLSMEVAGPDIVLFQKS
jgi:SAM-dependent methyltransferase